MLTDALADFDRAKVKNLTDNSFQSLAAQVLTLQREDRKENQLLYYRPVSSEAAKVHRSNSRYLGIGGGNGACLPLDAPVLMADGSWIALDQVRVGDKIMAANPETGEAYPASVTTTFRSGIKHVWRVRFSDGGWFDATDEHEIPIYKGSGRWTSKKNPMQPHKRALGTWRESVQRRLPAKRIHAISPRNIQAIETEPSIPPYLLGALLGDGGLTKSLRFFNKDTAVLERVAQHLSLLETEMVQYDAISWGLRGGRLRQVLKDMGLFGHTAHNKFLPFEVYGYSREDRLAVLAGLVDTDGGQDNYCTVSLDLAKGFVQLVHSLGGKASPRFHTNDHAGFYLIYWRMNIRVPLSLGYKQAVGHRRTIDYTRRVCRSVEFRGDMHCGDLEVDDPAHCYITHDFIVVSNSKTDTMLAEFMMHATGVYPTGLDDDYPGLTAELKAKFRGPIATRVVVESFTTTLTPIILPKLQWWQWSGTDSPGGKRGHYGWIPRTSLKDGSWERSWSEKHRLLRVLCRDPENPEIILGESTVQFLAKNQDPSDFASGDFHQILHDELCSYAQWREDEARTMRVGGRMVLSMTWPDDPSFQIDWAYDQLYEPGLPGPEKNPDVDWFELHTTDNPHLDQESVAIQARMWSDEIKAVRLLGRTIRFSNRIHPLFTDQPNWWCFDCRKGVLPKKNGACPKCKGKLVREYNHVRDFDTTSLPTIFLLDPHPRKPHMMLWAQVDTWDDIWVVAELEVDGDPEDVALAVAKVERELGLDVVYRLGDPNMLRSPAGKTRGVRWEDEFALVGLPINLGDTSDTGRNRLNEYLKPDPDRLGPRIHMHPRCDKLIKQLKRYVWGEFKQHIDRDVKQTPKEKDDDGPTLLKYLMNYGPTFRLLRSGPQIIRTRGRR